MFAVSSLNVDRFWATRNGAAPKLTAAVLLLCAAVSLACAVLTSPNDLCGATTRCRMAEAAAIAGPVVLLGASILVFFKPRLGYSLGVCVGLIALPWLVWTEHEWNSWIRLNIVADQADPLVKAFLTSAKLKILSVALIVTAMVCSSLRLLPARLLLREAPLCQRTWPALAVSSFVMAVWFAYAAMPYRAPRYIGGGMRAELRILHVEKRGLRLHETAVYVFKDGKVGLRRNDRRLFQYRFETREALSSLGAAPRPTLEQALALADSPELLKLHTPPARALRSRNAEGWYVVLKDSPPLAFTTEYQTAPPRQITDLFHEIEKLPVGREQPSAVQDICLGFCYDPAAALGLR